MRVILNAIDKIKSSYMPQKGWWSFKDNHYFYLCRYGHFIGKFDRNHDLIESGAETRTDKAGLNFCVRHLAEINKK